MNQIDAVRMSLDEVRDLATRILSHYGLAPDHVVPEVSNTVQSITRVDAKGGYAQLAFEMGLRALVENTKQTGIAALAINNCVHFAALWPEVERLANLGLVALACKPRMGGARRGHEARL